MDTRSLAVARVGFAIAILADLEQKSRFLSTFYTDQGILPRAAVTTFFNQPYFYSIHLASGDAWFQIILFLLAAVFALLMLVGYKTRLVTVISWFLLISLQARNMPILNAGDGILRLFVFWSMFLPMGAMWSVDSALHTGTKPEHRVFSAGSVAWIIQIMLIYWVTVALRQAPEWLSEGSALYYALQIDQLVTSFGHWLGQQQLGLLQFLTWCAVFIEASAPLFLLFPDKRGFGRFFAVFLGVSLHMGIFLMMHIGVFPFICMLSWIALLPGGFWDASHRWVASGRTGKGMTLYYDGDCGFCKKMVYLIRTFAALDCDIAVVQNDAKARAIFEREYTWVVMTEDGKSRIRWDGIAAVLERSPLWFWLAPLANWQPISALGDQLYRFVAHHRVQLGTFTKLLIFRESKTKLGIFGTLFACFCIALALAWNAQTLKLIPSIPAPIQTATLILRLDQYWNMFAPFPLKDDGWYVVDGTLLDGTPIDLQHDDKRGPVNFDKPTDLAASFPTESWRKYFLNLWLQDFEKYREFYAEYHCRRWNTTHTGEQRLKHLEIHFMREHTPPPEQRGTETVERLLIWQWDCGGLE